MIENRRPPPLICVVQWIRDDPPKRSKVFLDLALARGWQCYLSGKNPNNSFMDQWDVKIFQVGHALQDPKLPSSPALYRSSLTREAAIRLTDNWAALSQIDLTNSMDRIAEDEPWATMVKKTQYLIACAESTCEGKLLDWSVFASLWTAMAAFFVHAPTEHKYTASRLLQKLLDKVQKSISKTEVSREMDHFYRTLEDTRKEREPSRDAFDQVLMVSIPCLRGGIDAHETPQKIIDSRHWP
jgi:hypothetical protein